MGLIGSAFKAGPVFVEPLTRRDPRARARARAWRRGDGARRRQPAARRRARAAGATRSPPPELSRLLDEALRRASASARIAIDQRLACAWQAVAPRSRRGRRSRPRRRRTCARRRPRWRTARPPIGERRFAERDEERRGEHVAGAEVVDVLVCSVGTAQPRRGAAGREDRDRLRPRRSRRRARRRRRRAAISSAQHARSCSLTTSASQRSASAPRRGRRAARGRSAAPGAEPTRARVPAGSARRTRRARASALGLSRATGARCRIEVSSASSLRRSDPPTRAAAGFARSRSRAVRSVVVCAAGSTLQLELVAVGLEQRLDLAAHALREDQRAPAEPRGLQGAVEGGAAGAARAVVEHVDRHMADGRVVEMQVFGSPSRRGLWEDGATLRQAAESADRSWRGALRIPNRTCCLACCVA